MSAPNRNALWASAIVEELAAAGVDAVCLAPGSRSTPLTVAFAKHDGVRVFSHLDERSAAFFALGRARRTGRVTPVVCTSGTAAANFHPATIEADAGRVPLLLLTADRPPELRDSGANQTIDQEKLYGDAVRYYTDLPEPEPTARKLRSLRTTVARALSAAEGTPAGPVHLNVPLAKPLAPVDVEDDVPADLESLALDGRGSGSGTADLSGTSTAGVDGVKTASTPFVTRTGGVPEIGEGKLQRLTDALDVNRGLIVAGPADPPGFDRESVVSLAHATNFPILADPLSGLRFGGHTRVVPIIAGYDGYLVNNFDGGTAHSDEELDSTLTAEWPDPAVVIRLGATPTSKPLRKYLARTGADQYVVDPAGGWREAEFTATDLVVSDPSRLCARLAERLGRHSSGDRSWRRRWEIADREHFEAVEATMRDSTGTSDGNAPADNAGSSAQNTVSQLGESDDLALYEATVMADVVELAPEPATIFVSNSMPVRDMDRYVSAQPKGVTVLGNRGASGIDGIVSSALGAGSATADELICITGDLAYYHDMNGLLALERCDVDATIVLINNDGGGIFHKLPIEAFDPPFTPLFKTPHDLDLAATESLYDLSFASIDARPDSPDTEGTAPTVTSVRDAFRARLREAISSTGSHVIELKTDAGSAHRARDALEASVIDRIRATTD